jgi:CxxC-x17-CxxC domain-containing protein
MINLIFFNAVHRCIVQNLFLHHKVSKELKVVSGKEMFKATCSECGQECEVPFKPDPNRPVYCRECWAKRRPARPRRY